MVAASLSISVMLPSDPPFEPTAQTPPRLSVVPHHPPSRLSPEEKARRQQELQESAAAGGLLAIPEQSPVLLFADFAAWAAWQRQLAPTLYRDPHDPLPCRALPGSAEKIKIMQARVAKNLSAFSPEDPQLPPEMLLSLPLDESEVE